MQYRMMEPWAIVYCAGMRCCNDTSGIPKALFCCALCSDWTSNVPTACSLSARRNLHSTTQEDSCLFLWSQDAFVSMFAFALSQAASIGLDVGSSCLSQDCPCKVGHACLPASTSDTGSIGLKTCLSLLANKPHAATAKTGQVTGK